LHVRHSFGERTHLWLSRGLRPVRVTRTDPDRMPEPVLPDVPLLILYRLNQRGDEHVTELRLDHRAGRHRFSYGLAELRLDAQLFDLRYALPGSPGGRDVNRAPDLEDEGTSAVRDLLQYLQDEYRIGKRADLILGVQWLRRQD